MADSADPCSWARVSRLCIDVLGLAGEIFRDRFIDVDFVTTTNHNAQSLCGSNAVAGTKPRCIIGFKPDSDLTNSTLQFGLSRRLQWIRREFERVRSGDRTQVDGGVTLVRVRVMVRVVALQVNVGDQIVALCWLCVISTRSYGCRA